MNSIVSHAVAKVNLLLNVIGKTDDGYHELESVFAFLSDFYDELTFFPDIEFNASSANISGIPQNSIQKAAKILQAHFNKKIPHVVIKKNLPSAAGIGGGSSDSACFINTVFDIWGFSTEEKLSYLSIFKDLGSDNMIFLHKYFCGPRFVYLNGTGLDGKISNIDLAIGDAYVIVVNGGDRVLTKSVFERFRGPLKSPIGLGSISFESLKDFSNSLQAPALELLPRLSQILNDLKNTSPIFSGVSGSGATCFALYDDISPATKAQTTLKYPLVKLSKI